MLFVRHSLSCIEKRILPHIYSHQQVMRPMSTSTADANTNAAEESQPKPTGLVMQIIVRRDLLTVSIIHGFQSSTRCC